MSATEERAKAELNRATASADGMKTEATERAQGTNPTVATIKGKATEVSDRVAAVGHDVKAKVQEMTNSADNEASENVAK